MKFSTHFWATCLPSEGLPAGQRWALLPRPRAYPPTEGDCSSRVYSRISGAWVWSYWSRKTNLLSSDVGSYLKAHGAASKASMTSSNACCSSFRSPAFLLAASSFLTSTMHSAQCICFHQPSLLLLCWHKPLGAWVRGPTAIWLPIWLHFYFCREHCFPPN